MQILDNKTEMRPLLFSLREYWVIIFLSALLLRTVGIYGLLPGIIDTVIFSFIAFSGAIILFLKMFFIFCERNCGFLNKVCFLLFGRYFFQDFKKTEYKSSIPWDVFLTEFWWAALVSCAINQNYNFSGNIKELIWSMLNLFLVYFPADNMKKVIKKLQKILVIFCFSMSAISLMIFAFQINHIFYLEDKTIYAGFIENRLFGSYVNPNVGSKLVFTVILFSIYSLISGTKHKRFHIWAIIINFIYIALSSSRVTLVTMSVVLSIVFFWHAYVFRKKKLFSSVLQTSAACAAIVFLDNAVKKIFSYLPFFISKILGTHMQSQNINTIRLDIAQSGDISNLRFKIWLSAWELFKTTPIFGTSPRGIVEYAKNVLPDTFIAVKNYYFVHNTYIGTFVYTGIFGALPILAFFVKSLLNILFFYKEKSFQTKNKYLDIIVLLLITIFIYGIFEPEIIFSNTINCLLFWLFLSEVMRITKEDKNLNEFYSK
jgi:O-antigen ligase